MFEFDLKNAIPIESGPTRPKNIANDNIILPRLVKSAVIPIDKPTVPSADAASKHSSINEKCSVRVSK